MDDRQIPRVAILSAGFFALSLIAIPVGPTSVHLLLGGLMGLVLGPAVFVSLFAALLLQAMMFGFGGLTALGVNAVNIALPAVVFGALFAPLVARAAPGRAAVLGGVCASFCVVATALMVAGAFALSSPDYALSAQIMADAYIPLAVIEGVVTAFCISFVKRVRPDLLALTAREA